MKRLVPLLLLLCLILCGCIQIYTPPEIDAIKQESYQKGYDKGRTVGYEEGRIVGHDEGYAEGYDKGFQAGSESVNPPPPPPSDPITYVANKNTMKFHKPTCSSVNDIKQKNRLNWKGSREELIDKGYEPCQRCNP